MCCAVEKSGHFRRWRETLACIGCPRRLRYFDSHFLAQSFLGDWIFALPNPNREKRAECDFISKFTNGPAHVPALEAEFCCCDDRDGFLLHKFGERAFGCTSYHFSGQAVCHHYGSSS
ncbi:hypothetical protein X801_07263, partial [Opisthorchis viverrini]